MSVIRRIAAHLLLVSAYGLTWLVAVVGGWIPRRSWKPTGRIMVTGTFHNPNWYLSHVTPLARSGMQEVILVVDEPQLPFEGVRFVCPPKWLARLVSRAAAKAIWMFFAGLRYRPDLYMGYHLLPGACSALMAGKLLGRPSGYQMTGGPVGIIGGGFAAVDCIEGMLGRPSKLIEKLALRVVRQFDLVVVRGTSAQRYLADQGITSSVAVVTGSVNGCQQAPPQDRDIHLIYVGRLAPVKQIHQIIAAVDVIHRVMPQVRAAIVGDGPLMAELRAATAKLGLTQNIEFLGKRKDVGSLLARSKVFILTSRSEGLSIAMAEAMRAGAVPVVADVGDLGDLVADSVNGHLIEPNHVDEYARKAVCLLQDDVLWNKYSRAAVEAASSQCDIEVISAKWRRHLQRVVSQASGCAGQDVFD